MVRIINYKERQKENGEPFYVLELQGGIEMVQSQETGNFYATAKKAYISSTFDEETCIALIGTEMSGSVRKEACKPYEYTVKDTGEVIVLEHRYSYVPEVASKPATGNKLEADVNVFSMNGVHDLTEELV